MAEQDDVISHHDDALQTVETKLAIAA